MTEPTSPPIPCSKLFGEASATLTETITTDLGFDGILYSFYPKPMYLSKNVQPVLHYSDSFAPFVAHYLEPAKDASAC